MNATKRMKTAIKILLGKPIVSKPVSQEYHLVIDHDDTLNGKHVIVTGGTGAIGSAICFEMAARGAYVGICGRNITKLQETISTIEKGSPSVAERLIPLILDVNDDNQVELIFEEFYEKFGKLDLLVNNAGGQPGRIGEFKEHIYEKSIDQIDLVMNTNLRSTIICSRTACKLMNGQGFGHIVSMSSVIGVGGKAGYSDYAASKSGIIGFTKSLALEMAQYNVRINCISPGSINQVPFDYNSEYTYSSLNPMHRTGLTKEIAETVIFLENNKFITGQNIIVDGGRSIGLFGDQ